VIERKAVEIDELTVLIDGGLPIAVVDFDLYGLTIHRKFAFHMRTPVVSMMGGVTVSAIT